MSTYELDDADVEAWRAGSADAAGRVLIELKKQLPIPVPTKVGAVVRTDKGVLVRVSLDSDTNCEWWLMGQFETAVDQAKQWTETQQIGRIAEVLSEGVDL